MRLRCSPATSPNKGMKQDRSIKTNDDKTAFMLV